MTDSVYAGKLLHEPIPGHQPFLVSTQGWEFTSFSDLGDQLLVHFGQAIHVWTGWSLMIAFADLAETIARSGGVGKSLVSLVESPTSSSLINILASRVGFHVREWFEYDGFDLFVCVDSPSPRLPLRSPFGVICLDPHATEDAPTAHGMILDALDERHLQGKLVFLCHPGEFGMWADYLKLLPKQFVTFSTARIVEILLAHPPRTTLMNRIVAQTPLRLLNPYTFRGPVGGSMFVGRINELEKLCSLDHSYALVGPRTIGKTSLMSEACQKLLVKKQLVIRLEFSPALTEDDLHEQIVMSLIDDYKVTPNFMARISIPKTQRFLAKFATGFPQQRAAIFLDEADSVPERCPKLMATFRALHNRGAARLVFGGFKDLRKATNDAKNSVLMNVFHDLPLSGISREECGQLVIVPMAAMGITIEQPERVAEAIFRETGGAPSRIQLICWALVENLSRQNRRSLGPADVEGVSHLAQVQAVVRNWFRDSTSPLEKQLASLCSPYLPCTDRELAGKVLALVPEWTEHEITASLDDLRIADVFTLQDDGRLTFSFPGLREIVRPVVDAKASITDLVREARHWVRQARTKLL